MTGRAPSSVHSTRSRPRAHWPSIEQKLRKEENMTRTSARRAARVASRQARDRDILSKRSFCLISGGILLLLVVGIVFNTIGQAQAFSNPAAVGTAVPSMGGQHVQIGAQHAPYNSMPPTSGPHW